MTAAAPPKYERLLDAVVAALEKGSMAVARRRLVRARASSGEDDQLRGAIAALELVCAAHDDDDGRRHERLRELQERTSAEPLAFANAVGCTLSDAGERLGDDRWIELADAWFSRLVAAAPQPISLANHGIVLERLERLDEAIAALSRAIELDPDFHGARLRLARAASRVGDHERAADAFRAYLAVHPDNAHEWISLAIELCDLGQAERAEQAYWRAAGLEPANVSLHFNWLITAQRADDLERARDALTKLKAIAPRDWRTRVAEAMLLDKSGDPTGAFQLGRQVFHDLVADGTGEDEPDKTPIEYVAGRVSEILMRSRAELQNEATGFIRDVFAAEAFTDETLALIRAVEQPEADGLVSHSVPVEALYSKEDDPFGCFVTYRVFARNKDEASDFTRRFEERCGADDVRIRQDDIEQLEPCEAPVHAGVCWRSGRDAFPADEFGADD